MSTIPDPPGVPLDEANAFSEVALEIENEILDSADHDLHPEHSSATVCRRCGQQVPVLGGRIAAHTRPVPCRDSGRPVGH